MVVDPVHHRTFISGSGVIAVRTDLGAAVSTITGASAVDLALSPDSSVLFASLGSYHSIRAYSTSTLELLATYATSSGVCPRNMALSGSKIWFTNGCDSGDGLDLLDLGVDPPTVTTHVVDLVAYAAREVAVNPANASQLLLLYDTMDPGPKLSLVDVSQPAPTVTATVNVLDYSINFTYSADGSSILATRHAAGGAHPRWSSTDLAVLPAYGAGVPAADAINVSASGYLVGGVDASSSTTDVRVYDSAGGLVRTFDFGPCCTSTQLGRLVPRGALLTSDAGRLYAVTYDGSTHLALRVLSGPTKRVTTMSLTSPTGAVLNTTFTIKGSISSATPIPTGQTLTVTRSSSYGKVARPAVTTTTGGAFAINDAVSARGWYSYTVSWAGDAGHATVSRSVSVYVKGKATSVSVAVSSTAVNYGTAVTVTGHLGTSTKIRQLSIFATPAGGSATRLKTATVDSSGNIRGTWTPSTNTTYSAKFTGDSLYEPASASRVVGVRPLLSFTVSYSYAKSGSTWLFHNNVNPIINVKTRPLRGGCLVGTEQKLVSGTWKTIDVNSCLAIYSTTDMTTGGSRISMYDDPRSGTFRIRISFAQNAYFLGTSLPWITYRYTS